MLQLVRTSATPKPKGERSHVNFYVTATVKAGDLIEVVSPKDETLNVARVEKATFKMTHYELDIVIVA